MSPAEKTASEPDYIDDTLLTGVCKITHLPGGLISFWMFVDEGGRRIVRAKAIFTTAAWDEMQAEAAKFLNVANHKQGRCGPPVEIDLPADEPYPAPEIFITGLDGIQDVPGGLIRFRCCSDASGEKRVVLKTVFPREAFLPMYAIAETHLKP